MKSWIPLKNVEEMAQQDYDVLIIGTGAGGSSVLWRLCEKHENQDKKIGVIEAGDILLQSHALNLSTMNWSRLEDFFEEHSVKIGEKLEYKQICALGGRTLFWGSVTPRMGLETLYGWNVNINELDYYYRVAEGIMDVTIDYWKDSSIQNVMISKLHNSGIIDAADIPFAVNLQPTKFGIIQSNPVWSSISMFGYALNSRPFDLAVNSMAIRVLYEGQIATGVEVLSIKDHKKYFLKAKKIVISGGPIETPKLLLQSNVDNIPVGNYLATHSKVRAFGYISRSKIPEMLGTLGVIIPGSSTRPYQILCLGPQNILYNRYPRFETQPYNDFISIQLEAYGEVEPRYSNKVSLDFESLDEFGFYKPKINFSYSIRDLEVIELSKRALYEVSVAMGLQLYSYHGLPLIHHTEPDSAYHASSTCRMGIDPRNSVVNHASKVHGFDNLFVADNSVLPSVGTANPTLTTVALAIRTADIITIELNHESNRFT